MTLDSDTSVTKTKSPYFTINFYSCPVQLPLDLTSHEEYRFTVLPGLEPVILDLTTASLGQCDFTTSLTADDVHQGNNLDSFSIIRDSFDFAGSYNVVYQME